MKRIVALLVSFVLFLSIVPAVHAYETPVTSSNRDKHVYVNAKRFNDPITSALEVVEDGYCRVECVGDKLIVEKYDWNFQFVSGEEIQLELPIYGGVYLCDDYNFVVVGQTNMEEDDGKEVFRIIRYSKDWVRQESASIYGANTTIPFDAGSLRFARSGDILYIRTAHEMYTSSDGYNHQANVMIAVRISDMTVTDQLTKVWNNNYGYVSHSFNQFVLVDGDDLLAVDHGDAIPRSVVMFKYGVPAGQETFYSRVSMVEVLPIVDSTYHYNDTGVSVGGFEASSDHYLVAGSSADQTVKCDLMYAHRNIFVTATPKDDFSEEATTVRWLTSFTEEDDVDVSPPHLVKISSDRFFLIWTENGQIHYCTLDGKGALEGEIQSAEGDLSDCVPVVYGSKIIWYVTDDSEPEFYVIDLDASAHTHSYAAQVTAPTCQTDGYTTYTCTDCGDSYVDDYTDPVDHSYVDGYCQWCGAGEQYVKFSTYTTSLGGNIAMNFYVELSKDLLEDPNAYMQFTFAGRTTKVPLSQGVESQKNGVTVYMYACPITSKNMSDNITAQVVNASGNVGESKTMAVDTYCNWIIANYKDEKTINLMKAMLNYGASAQMLFNHNTDDLANASLSDADKVLTAVDASAYIHSRTGEEDGIKASSYTLLLDSETTVRCYFELTGDKTIDEFTFTVDGVEVEPQYKNGRYYIEKKNIAAHRLDDMHVFTCGGITITYGGLSYVNQVMTYYTEGTTFDMAVALYNYSQASEAYIA